MTKKIMVTAYDNIHLDYVTIDQAIQQLEEMRNKHGGKARINIESYDYYGSPTTEIRVPYQRPETDVEQAKRLESEERNKEYRRKQLESLKKEFGEV